MPSTVRAYAEFDFRGQHHRLTERFDLAVLADSETPYQLVYAGLAQAAGIAPYSYEYEVLLDQSLTFSDADAGIEVFVQPNDLDFEGYRRWRREQAVQRRLQQIAEHHLGIADLNHEPGLLAALQAAWNAGAESET